jgi:hypothetical protein
MNRTWSLGGNRKELSDKAKYESIKILNQALMERLGGVTGRLKAMEEGIKNVLKILLYGSTDVDDDFIDHKMTSEVFSAYIGDLKEDSSCDGVDQLAKRISGASAWLSDLGEKEAYEGVRAAQAQARIEIDMRSLCEENERLREELMRRERSLEEPYGSQRDPEAPRGP